MTCGCVHVPGGGKRELGVPSQGGVDGMTFDGSYGALLPHRTRGRSESVGMGGDDRSLGQ